ncbi:MAG: hypothetical protein IKF52_06325 [Clostridia bacterium]|nr:hypothetical protein [Clostridia bacterium]
MKKAITSFVLIMIIISFCTSSFATDPEITIEERTEPTTESQGTTEAEQKLDQELDKLTFNDVIEVASGGVVRYCF